MERRLAPPIIKLGDSPTFQDPQKGSFFMPVCETFDLYASKQETTDEGWAINLARDRIKEKSGVVFIDATDGLYISESILLELQARTHLPVIVVGETNKEGEKHFDSSEAIAYFVDGVAEDIFHKNTYTANEFKAKEIAVSVARRSQRFSGISHHFLDIEIEAGEIGKPKEKVKLFRYLTNTNLHTKRSEELMLRGHWTDSTLHEPYNSEGRLPIELSPGLTPQEVKSGTLFDNDYGNKNSGENILFMAPLVEV